MSPLLKKEIRLLFPVWCVALLLAAVPLWFIKHPANVGAAWWIAAVGSVILAVTAFGRESALGTFSLMLALPVPRKRIILTKGLLLLLALASVLAVYWLSYVAHVGALIDDPRWYWDHSIPMAEQMEAIRQQRWEVLFFGGVGAATIFAGGLWTTLVFREMVASFWITVLAPSILIVGTTWLASTLFHFEAVAQLVCAALLIYAIGGIVGSWRLFQRTQDTPLSWGAKTLPALSELIRIRREPRGRSPGHPVMTLIRQELSLHQTSLIGVAVLLLFNVVSIGIRASGVLDEKSNIHDILELIGVFWFLVPLMIGAASIAEERRMGTLESHLCLPVSHRMQFLVKSGVAGSLGVLLGAGALLATELLGRQLGVVGILGRSGIDAEPLFWLAAINLGLTLAGFYASSLSRSTIQALGLGIVFWLSAIFIFMWADDHFLIYRNGEHGWSPTSWILWLHVGTFFCVLGVLVYRNFRQIQSGLRWVVQNVLIIILTLTMVATLSAGIFFRAWELVIPLEPEHGPAQIAGHGEAKIAAMWAGGRVGNLVVLLPDGRLWSSELLYEGERYVVPDPGAFLATSNWTDVAACSMQVIALQSDGTLWSLFRSERISKQRKLVEAQPRQIGTESNWIGIATGRYHLLALKGDGTLWGWGGNSYSQVCEGPEVLTNGPVRIGLDSDWTQVFARDHSSVGVKRDGSSWQWGHISTEGKDGLLFQKETYTQPVRWDADLREVKKLVGGRHPFDLLLHKNGSLWAQGPLYYDLLGSPTGGHYAHEPVRVGGDRLWSDIDWTWNGFVGVSKDGRLWKETNRKPKQKSNHDDWIAVEGSFGPCTVALAADGTLSFWEAVYQQGPLAPTRRPISSFNIFDETE